MNRQGKNTALRAIIRGSIQAACAQKGFDGARLILDWDKIVPPQFRNRCQPLELTFPHKQRENGRLVLRAPSSVALELGYVEPYLIKVINQYFGYAAVSRLHIQQGPLHPIQHTPSPSPPRDPVSLEIQQHIRQDVDTIADKALADALFAFGCSIYARKGMRPFVASKMKVKGL